MTVHGFLLHTVYKDSERMLVRSIYRSFGSHEWLFTQSPAQLSNDVALLLHRNLSDVHQALLEFGLDLHRCSANEVGIVWWLCISRDKWTNSFPATCRRAHTLLFAIRA